MDLLTRLKQLVDSPRKKSTELELALLGGATNVKTPPLRKICRCPTTKNMQPAITQGQNGERTDSPADSQHEHEHRTIKNSKLEKLLRFGPCYGDDMPGMLDTKKHAWEHVLEKTSELEKKEREVAKEVYNAAIRKVEQEARKIYFDPIECPNNAFRKMMMKDGCFFLQLALLILGGSKQLGYTTEDLIFGRTARKKDVNNWIESMFFTGNQIPLVVLKELMAQEFFKKVIKDGKWDSPHPSYFCKKVLYDLLILPPQRRNQGAKPDEQPSDVLHGLHNLVMGPEPPRKKKYGIYKAEYDSDLEANDQNNSDDNSSNLGDFTRTDSMRTAIADPKKSFPSATDLDQLGIRIKMLKSGGVRSISFKSKYFRATLHLPALPINEDVEMIFSNLAAYENSQQFEMTNHRGEVNSYLQFMSDLIQTSKDVKLLKRKGIIQGSSKNEDNLSEILSRLSIRDKPLTQNFHILRHEIRDYSGPPWFRVKSILNIVAIFTVLQTVFTILAYVRPTH